MVVRICVGGWQLKSANNGVQVLQQMTLLLFWEQSIINYSAIVSNIIRRSWDKTNGFAVKLKTS